MRTGDEIAGRFVLEREAGAGGMGTVYRALDRRDGAPVALKVLHVRGAREVERFLREAQLLAELGSPHVVRHVASGTTTEGEPYLAMEWLDGEDLEARLARGALSIPDAMTMVRGACEGLALAHRRGVIHRDIKPSNLFLADGDVGRVKLLDFGIARRAEEKRGLTGTGALLGTPAYMAPEQARGTKTLSPSVDVFALGCVLFEAIAARPAFVGENMMAVLAKVLLEDAPLLREVAPATPSRIERLVAQLLDKNPERRPADAEAVRALVDQLDAPDRPVTISTEIASGESITSAEQRIVSVVLAGDSLSGTEVAATIAADSSHSGLVARIAAHGARLEVLADGTYVALLSGEGTPLEHAAVAARCALALSAEIPEAPIVLATGRGVVAARLPTGVVIDRAVALLRGTPPGTIRIDEDTAGLVDRRFEIGADALGLFLRGERDVTDIARTVLGKRTPCLGRDRELASLESLLDECIDEPVARAVLVSAPAGTGKSRLLQEFVGRAGERSPAPEILVGRGDSSAAGSPFALLGTMLRRACSVDESEPLEARRRRVRARIGRHVDPSRRVRVSAFLGEIAGVPFDEGEVPLLSSARSDAQIMGDAITTAVLDWLGDELAAQPVVLVLDDLHWGDYPSVRLVDTLLRVHRERPLLVIALARPTVHETFPSLWDTHDPTEIRLPALTRKNAERLVREVLGSNADAALVTRIVDRSEGNAFFLEEIVRAIGARGTMQAIPDTVLGMVQARFDALDETARRALRAASVFGERFWRAGVERLLGDVSHPPAPHDRDGARDGHEAIVGGVRVSEWIAPLVEREMIVSVPDARLGGESAHQFRHALVRDAAYAMLTDADRVLAHRLAGEWLVERGESDAALLARHFEIGGCVERAVDAYCSAGLQALEGNDLARAMQWAKRGIELGAQGRTLGRLWLMLAEAHHWRAEYDAMLDAARESSSAAPRGSAEWYQAKGIEANACALRGDYSPLVGMLEEISETPPEPDAARAQVRWLARSAIIFIRASRPQVPPWLKSRLESLLEQMGTTDPQTTLFVREALVTPLFGVFDPGAMATTIAASADEFERMGDVREMASRAATAGFLLTEVAEYDRAAALLERAIAVADRLGLASVGAVARHNLGWCRLVGGHVAEAHELQLRALEMFERSKSIRLAAAAHLMFARECVATGDLAGVERHAHTAIELAPTEPRSLVEAYGYLADVARKRGDLSTARTWVAQSVAIYEQDRSLMLRFYGLSALAEIALAEGNEAEARAAVSTAVERMSRAVSQPSDARLARGFLTVPDRAGVIALARRLGVDLSSLAPYLD